MNKSCKFGEKVCWNGLSMRGESRISINPELVAPTMRAMREIGDDIGIKTVNFNISGFIAVERNEGKEPPGGYESIETIHDLF